MQLSSLKTVSHILKTQLFFVQSKVIAEVVRVVTFLKVS